MKARYLYVCGVILFIGMGSAFAYKHFSKDSKTEETALTNTQTPVKKTEAKPQNQSHQESTLRLIATGDMIAHDTVNQNAKKPDGSYDYFSIMADMKPYFEKSDVRFCNQATPAGGEQFGISGYPVFNAPLAFTTDLVKLGCNIVNIGTNHTNDKGQALINAVVKGWQDQQGVLAFAGANRDQKQQDKVKFFEKSGIKFAFLSYTTYSNKPPEHTYSVNMWRDELVAAQLNQARAEADFVIVSMRWGTEYSPDINADQNSKAQTLADHGADLILGHGPHVLEPVKKLKAKDGREAVVWFSLGNFLNSQLEPETLIGGMAIVHLDTVTKKIKNLGFMPVYMHYEWTAAQKTREDLLSRNNLKMIPLDKATELLNKSQNNTTVEAQTTRIRDILNKFTDVQIISSDNY